MNNVNEDRWSLVRSSQSHFRTRGNKSFTWAGLINDTMNIENVKSGHCKVVTGQVKATFLWFTRGNKSFTWAGSAAPRPLVAAMLKHHQCKWW